VLYGRAPPVGASTEPWEQGEGFLPSGTGGLDMKHIPVSHFCLEVLGVFLFAGFDILMHVFIIRY